VCFRVDCFAGLIRAGGFLDAGGGGEGGVASAFIAGSREISKGGRGE